ncbi:MAG: amidohydrolase [Thermoprotei archaeon]
MGLRDKTYTLTKCRAVIKDANTVETDVNVVIEKGVIKRLDKREKEGDELDCNEYVVVPGLVNAHTHAAMVALRGYGDDKELNEWLQDMWSFERSFPKELMRLSTLIAALEMLERGVSAFVDMYFNPEDVLEATELYGVRAQAGYTFLDSMFDPSNVMKNQRSLRRTELFTPIVNVHSPYAVSKETLRSAFDLARELKQRVQIHVSETRMEAFVIKRAYGLFPVEYLLKQGLPKGSQLVHLGWVTSWELAQLKDYFATYCPTSSMKLATAGAFPLREAFDQRVSVSLGTDGPASNNSLDVFREMKNAVLQQRHNYWDDRIGARDVFKMATEEGYKLIGVRGGRVEEGYVADLALLDAEELYPFKGDRLLSHIVYYATGDIVKAVIVNGELKSKEWIRSRKIQLVKELNSMLTS